MNPKNIFLIDGLGALTTKKKAIIFQRYPYCKSNFSVFRDKSGF